MQLPKKNNEKFNELMKLFNSFAEKYKKDVEDHKKSIQKDIERMDLTHEILVNGRKVENKDFSRKINNLQNQN